MNINTVNQVSSLTTQATTAKTSSPFEAQESFATILKDSLEKVNETQIQSDEMTQKLINGDDVELHDVMISAQKANITLQATLEVRNKAVEAYQEIMRMNI